MSRTFRKPQHWVKNCLESELQHRHLSPKFLGSMVRQMRGQDGSGNRWICYPNRTSPTGRGYAEIGGKLGKQFAKKAVARIHRRRGSKEIKQQLVELHQAEEEAHQELMWAYLDEHWYDDEPMFKDDEKGSCYLDDEWRDIDGKTHFRRDYDDGIDDDPWGDYIPYGPSYRKSQAERKTLGELLEAPQERSLGDILAEAIERRSMSMRLNRVEGPL